MKYKAEQIDSKAWMFGRAVLGIITTLSLALITFWLWRYAVSTVALMRREMYDLEIEDIARKVTERVDTAVDTLYGLRGMLAIAGQSSREWRSYLFESGIEARYPGLFSFAFVETVNKDDINEYVDKVKATEKEDLSYQDFFIFPITKNEQVYPLRLLLTSDPDVRLLLGLDTGSVASWSRTLSESTQVGKPMISELTSLKQILPMSDKAGYLIALPVYWDERVAGFTAVWIESGRLFGRLAGQVMKYDVLEDNHLVLSSDSGEKGYVKKLRLLNREFSLAFSGPEQLRLSFFQENLPLFVVIGGLLITGLWYGTMASVLVSRKRAVALAEEAIKDLKKFKLAVEGVSDHVIITDSEGVIIYANKAAARITGYSVKEMIGQRPSLWGKQMSESFYRKMWKTVKTDRKPFYGQLTNKRKNGELYEVDLRISPISDTKGSLVYFVGIERDITKAKAVEKMKTEFISLASHQLRTPLSAIKWFSQMLLDGDAGKLSRLQKEYMENISASNEREIHLVNSLLNISRIESGRISIAPKDTDLRKLVESVVADAGVSEDRRVRQIELEIERGIPLINTDPDLMRHVYMNLLSNAIRYTGEKGKIKVTIKIKGDTILSSVTDNGIGIPKNEQGRIFERFFRAANAMKRETEGSGLGLYLVKTIVESSGGKIWFESQEGRGTTFYFTLPVVGMKAKKGEVSLV